MLITRSSRWRITTQVPEEISNLFAWWDPSQETTYNDDDSISLLTDFSGNGKDLDSTTNAPTYKTGIVNGQPVIRFPTTISYIEMTSGFGLDGTDAFDLFIALRTTEDVTAIGNARVVFQFREGSTVGTWLTQDDESGASTDDVMETILKCEVPATSSNQSNSGDVSPGVINDGNLHLVRLSWQSTYPGGPFTDNHIMDVDGANVFTGGNAGSELDAPFGEFRLGRNSSNPAGYEGWIGDVAEVIIYNRRLSSEEVTQIETYFDDKYGTSFA